MCGRSGLNKLRGPIESMRIWTLNKQPEWKLVFHFPFTSPPADARHSTQQNVRIFRLQIGVHFSNRKLTPFPFARIVDDFLLVLHSNWFLCSHTSPSTVFSFVHFPLFHGACMFHQMNLLQCSLFVSWTRVRSLFHCKMSLRPLQNATATVLNVRHACKDNKYYYKSQSLHVFFCSSPPRVVCLASRMHMLYALHTKRIDWPRHAADTGRPADTSQPEHIQIYL